MGFFGPGDGSNPAIIPGGPATPTIKNDTTIQGYMHALSLAGDAGGKRETLEYVGGSIRQYRDDQWAAGVPQGSVHTTKGWNDKYVDLFLAEQAYNEAAQAYNDNMNATGFYWANQSNVDEVIAQAIAQKESNIYVGEGKALPKQYEVANYTKLVKNW